MAKTPKGKLPPSKETCLRLAYVLYKAGGQLSIHRAVELLGEYFGLSDDLLGYHASGGQPVWTNFVQWARQNLNADGFLEPVAVSGYGVWRLSTHGKELGRWAAAFYDDRRTDLPPWVADYLAPVRKRIKGFLRGSNAAKPSDDELCRWVDMCYRLEMWSEGVEVFRRVLKDNVSNGLYKTAERQSRICELRLSEASGTGNGNAQGATPSESASGSSSGGPSVPRRRGELVIKGRTYSYVDAKDAMAIVLRELASGDDGFLERCSRHPDARGSKRRYIARSVEELYPGRPDLFRYHVRLPDGWLVATNLSNSFKMTIIRMAVSVAGLRFGRDVVVEL